MQTTVGAHDPPGPRPGDQARVTIAQIAGSSFDYPTASLIFSPVRPVHSIVSVKTLWWCVVLLLDRSPQVGAQSGGFADGVQVGQIADNNLAELSGIASSRHNPGVLWVHNDRNRDKLYAVSTNGQLLATYTLGKAMDDFEDLAIGPGPSPELHYLYCGDIGDNAGTRTSLRVYRAGEPAVYAELAANPPSQELPLVDKITLLYPDGSHNAEALLLDPLTGDLYIATKQTGISGIYRADRAQLQDGATVTLSFVTQVDFHEVSSGDISADGQEIILRQENFAKLWRRAPGQTIEQALTETPVYVPVIGAPTEPNGEGVAFDGGGLGYYTVSEGVQPAIYFFAKIDGPRPALARTLLPAGSVWKFLDNGSDQGTAWRNPVFVDGAWSSGPAQLGYGEDDQRTVIGFGADKDSKHVTTYFRKQFDLGNAVPAGALTLSAVYDDGLAVYLNGTEVLRRNLAANATFSEAALASGSSLENLWQTFTIANALRAGTNTLAVEVHRRSLSEGDLSFDLQLLAGASDEVLQFTASPRRVSPGAWALDFRGPAGASVFVEGASGFNTWSNLGSVVLSNGSGSFTNSPAGGVAWSFYRLRR